MIAAHSRFVPHAGVFVVSMLLGTISASACRFNVRDVGFVDLGSNPYKFYCVVSPDTAPETVTSIKQIATAAFLDVNIETEIVELGDSIDPAVAAYYKEAGEPQPPIGILVPADGDSPLTVPLIVENESLDESLWSAMESTFESPVRDQITEKAIEHFGVILLVEGNDAAENKRSKETANAIIQRIEGSLDQLEKAIDKPPVLVSLTKSDAAAESVFLWSLGIEPSAAGANIAVLYGRGRTIGSVLSGEDISEQKLFQVVATIGLDCECGLDRSWMQGKMLPLKWGSSFQARVAEVLGFDAEDPRIKMEMSQILSKSGTGNGSGRQRPGEGQNLDTFLANYAETAVEVPATEDKGGIDAATIADELSPTGAGGQAEQRPNRVTAYVALAVIGTIVLVLGSIIALRGRSSGA
jgi:hypothetical protein